MSETPFNLLSDLHLFLSRPGAPTLGLGVVGADLHVIVLTLGQLAGGLRCRGAFGCICLLALGHLGVLGDTYLILVSPGHLRPGRLDLLAFDVDGFLHCHFPRLDFDGVGLSGSLVVGCF